MPVKHDRDADRDLLAGDELLEVDVQDLALERVALDLADQRLGGAAVDRQLDDGALGGDALKQLLELARVERERLRLAAVAVDDGRESVPALRSLRAAPLPVESRLLRK